MSTPAERFAQQAASQTMAMVNERLSASLDGLAAGKEKPDTMPDRYFFDRTGKIFTVKPNGSHDHPGKLTIKDFSESGYYMPRVEIEYINEDMSSAPKAETFIETHPLREPIKETRFWATNPVI